jgi:hypothetical protein
LKQKSIKKKFEKGRNFGDLIFAVSFDGNVNNIKIDANIAITPPVLLGIARKIA